MGDATFPNGVVDGFTIRWHGKLSASRQAGANLLPHRGLGWGASTPWWRPASCAGAIATCFTGAKRLVGQQPTSSV
eukprot:3768723-Pyramimonas_sp.AAC.1